MENKLAGSAHPGFSAANDEELVETLRSHGIGAVASLEEMGLNGHALRDSGIEHLQIPIPDFHAPSVEQIDEFVAFVNDNAAANRAVLAHCHAGMGRTGTMIASYLVSLGDDPRVAINTVRRRRPGSIETYGQEDAIYDYFRWLHRNNRLPVKGNAGGDAAPPGGERRGEP